MFRNLLLINNWDSSNFSLAFKQSIANCDNYQNDEHTNCNVISVSCEKVSIFFVSLCLFLSCQLCSLSDFSFFSWVSESVLWRWRSLLSLWNLGHYLIFGIFFYWKKFNIFFLLFISFFYLVRVFLLIFKIILKHDYQ